jgi:2-oxo-4-hydroxy-4-carboxy-5-ureidoimidazoline decarboxylase
MDTLQRLDTASPDDAAADLRRCCGSSRWVQAMVDARPFGTEAALRAAAATSFERLRREDWLEAFAHHPRIGDRAALEARFASTRSWSAAEQGAVSAAGRDVLDRLAAVNRAYEERFGYVFIVCATGKSPQEMLVLAEARLGNDPAAELPIAAAEQRRITDLRLTKLLSGEVHSPSPGGRA